MGDISKNFSRSEFACTGTNYCGHSGPVHPELISVLQALRYQLNLPLKILAFQQGGIRLYQSWGHLNSNNWESEVAR